MSELDAEFVHRGYWIDRSRGQVMGGTITADAQTGLIITAILAICTTVGTTHLWYILTFFFHQIRAHEHPVDGLYRQQQALLRTLPPPSRIVAESFKMFFAWKGHTPSNRIVRRSLAQIVVASAFVILSITAGIFSSYIVVSSDLEVLVKSPMCGLFWSHEAPATLYAGQVLTTATQYAEACYLSKSPKSAQCGVFTNPKIGYTRSNASCPFSGGLCASQAVAFDSGLVDINDAFGLNLADSDRVKYRKRTTCAILNDQNRTRLVDANNLPAGFSSGLIPEEEAMLYSWSTRKSGAMSDTEYANTTFVVSMLTSNMSSRYFFDRQTFRANVNSSARSAYELAPDLARDDADTVVFIVAKGQIEYREQVDDPFFSAHRPFVVNNRVTASNITLYKSDTIASTFGCTEQFQACVAVSGKPDNCTELGPIFDDYGLTYARGNEVQQKYIRILKAIGDSFRIGNMQGLNATSMAVNGVVDYLPDDHWISELDRWNAIIFATHQIIMTDYASGPGVRDQTLDYEHPPTDPAWKSLCRAQKMRKSGGFVNINLFGLIFILTFAVALTLLDFFILRIFMLASRFRRGLSPRIDRWIQDGVYQLQRRAYSSQGKGEWRRVNEEIPVVVDSKDLPELSQRPSEKSASALAANATNLTLQPLVHMSKRK